MRGPIRHKFTETPAAHTARLRKEGMGHLVTHLRHVAEEQTALRAASAALAQWVKVTEPHYNDRGLIDEVLVRWVRKDIRCGVADCPACGR